MTAARIIEIDRARRPRPDESTGEIVAVVLADGTVRDLRTGDADHADERFEGGQVDGDGWTLWWERRAW